jgi:hypothetical protein
MQTHQSAHLRRPMTRRMKDIKHVDHSMLPTPSHYRSYRRLRVYFIRSTPIFAFAILYLSCVEILWIICLLEVPYSIHCVKNHIVAGSEEVRESISRDVIRRCTLVPSIITYNNNNSSSKAFIERTEHCS